MSGVHPAVMASLAECEAVIERGMTTFMDVGEALLRIHDDKLYRESGHRSFDAYCKARWGWTRDRGTQLMRAATTAKTLTNVGGSPPENEAQARELAPLKDDPPAMAEVMQEASANGAKPTANAVKAAVQKRVAPKLPPCGGCAKPVDPAKKGNIPECHGDDGSLNSPAWHAKCWDAAHPSCMVCEMAGEDEPHVCPATPEDLAADSDERDATLNRERHAKAAPAVAAIDAILTEQAEDDQSLDAIVGDEFRVFAAAVTEEPDDAEVVEPPPEPDDGKPVAFADVVLRVVGGADRALKPIRISLAATRDADTIANVIRVAVATELLARPLKIAKGKS